MTPLLEAEEIGISFGGLTALQGVSVQAFPGEVLSIIGPNGAGKTTLFNIISGLYRPSHGRVRLDGEEVTDLKPFELARRGLSRTFQNLQIFFRMSVAENVVAGRHRAERASLVSDLFALPASRRQRERSRQDALALLDRVGLAGRADEPAANLPYGALKRLEIARALATEPKALLFDEPAAGCNATETEEIDTIIRGIARAGVAVVLVEHDMRLVMNISDRVLVLDQGRPLSEGPPAAVRADPKVVAAYLGQHGSKEARDRAAG